MEEGTNLLETLGTAVSFIVDQFTNFASELLATPLFLIPIAIFVVGAAIGLVKRLV